MKTFKDKIAVITGGNSGISYSTTKKLHHNDARVIIIDRRKEAAEKAASQQNVKRTFKQSRLNDIFYFYSNLFPSSGTNRKLLCNMKQNT